MMSVLTIPHDSNKTWLWAFQSLSRDDERSDLLYALNTDTGHGCSNPSVGMMSVLTKPIICRKELACMRSNPSVGMMSVLTKPIICRKELACMRSNPSVGMMSVLTQNAGDERDRDGRPVPIPQSG